MSDPVIQSAAAQNSGTTAGKPKSEDIRSSDRGSLTVGQDGLGSATLTTLAGLPITITGVLTGEQTKQLGSFPKTTEGNAAAISQFLEIMGVTKPMIALLQKLGITGVDIGADGKVTYIKKSSQGDERSFAATQLNSFFSTDDIANSNLCSQLIMEIMKMPGEARHMVIEMLIKWAKENDEKAKVLQKQLDVIISQKKEELKALKKAHEKKETNEALTKAIGELKAGKIPSDKTLSALGLPAADLILELAILSLFCKANNGEGGQATQENTKVWEGLSLFNTFLGFPLGFSAGKAPERDLSGPRDPDAPANPRARPTLQSHRTAHNVPPP